MANYYGKTRSNYFRVVDVDKFKEVCKDFELEFIENEGKVGFITSNQDSGIPCDVSSLEDEDEYGNTSNKYEGFDTYDEIIASMLVDDDVMIINHIGSEKFRFLNGFATAYNNKGEIRNIDFMQIYKLAFEIGKNITECSY